MHGQYTLAGTLPCCLWLVGAPGPRAGVHRHVCAVVFQAYASIGVAVIFFSFLLDRQKRENDIDNGFDTLNLLGSSVDMKRVHSRKGLWHNTVHSAGLQRLS